MPSQRTFLSIATAYLAAVTSVAGAAGLPPVVPVNLNAYVANAAAYSDTETVYSSLGTAVEKFDDVPATGFLDPAYAFASPYQLGVLSQVTHGNGLVSFGPQSDAALSGTRLRVSFPQNIGLPKTIPNASAPNGPPLQFDGAYLPLTVKITVAGTAGSPPFESTSGTLNMGASATCYSLITDASPLGSIEGSTTISGSGSFSVGSSGLNAGLTGAWSTLAVTESPDNITDVFTGTVYLPLPIFSATLADGTVTYMQQDFALAVNIGTKTDSISGYIDSEIGLSFIGDPVAAYSLPVVSTANDSTPFATSAVAASPAETYVSFADLGATVTDLPQIVPEPSSLAALALGSVTLLRRTRKSSTKAIT